MSAVAVAADATPGRFGLAAHGTQGALAFVLALALFALNVDFKANGDVFQYANIIDARAWHDHTLHQGYYLVGLAFQQLASYVVALPTVEALTWLNVVVGALNIWLAWHIAGHFLAGNLARWLTVLVMAMSYRVFSNATTAEVYALQTLFIYAGYLLFLQKRYALTGVSYALAMWVAPLSVFFSLFFPAVALVRRYPFGSLVIAAVPVALLYGAFLALFYEELLWGPRGLIRVDGNIPMDPLFGTQQFLQYTFKHYTFGALLLLPALLAVPRHWSLMIVTLAAALPSVYVLWTLTFEDNTFILTLDLFFSMWIVVGLQALARWRLQLLGYALLAAQIGLFAWTQRLFVDGSQHAFLDELTRRAERVLREDTVLISDWDNRIALVYQGRDRPRMPFWQGRMYFAAADRIDVHLSPPDRYDHLEYVYVIEPYSQTPIAQLFISDAEAARRFEQHSIRLQVERKFNRACELFEPGVTDLYRCHRRE